MPKPLPSELTEKLVKLLPMLGSDSMGEVIATIEAIKRALTAHDCDWHDVVARVAAADRPRANVEIHDYQPGANTYPPQRAYNPYTQNPGFNPSPNPTQGGYTKSYSTITKDSQVVTHNIAIVMNHPGYKPSASALRFLNDTKDRASKYDTVRFTEKQWNWYSGICREVGVQP